MASESIILLDGGMGSELSARNIPVPPTIWSAAALMEHPDAVIDIHKDYARAGAQVITTNNYGVIPAYLKRVDQEQALIPWTERALNLALQAQEAFSRAGGHPTRIAGSLPPLVESYRPDLVMDNESLATYYEAIAATLKPGIDIFLAETMSSIREAEAVVAAVNRCRCDRQQLWISFTLADQPGMGLRSGEAVGDAVRALMGKSVDAILFNCCPPVAITQAIGELRRVSDIPTGGYANVTREIPEDFLLIEASGRLPRNEMTRQAYTGHVQNWVSGGATIVGGCCGIGPDKIAALHHAFSEAPATANSGPAE